MRWGSLGHLLLASVVGFAAVGCADECVNAGDCKASEVCTAGECVVKVRPPPGPADDIGPRPDARADAGPADTGEPDDSGVQPDAEADAGVPDSGDGGPPPDASPDAGSAVAENFGLLQVSEIATSTGTELRVFGRFIGYAVAGVHTQFSAGTASSDLLDRVVTNNAGNGYGGNAISVAGFNGPFIPNDGTLFLAATVPGIFEPKGGLAAALLWAPGQTNLTYTVPVSTRANQITRATDMLSGVMPRIQLSQPSNMSSVLTIGAGTLDVVWQPTNDPAVRAVVEIYNGRRTAVLRCEDDDSGMMSIPLAARRAFVGIAPVGPYRVDIVYEKSKILQVPVTNGPAIPTTIRHRAGQRFTGM